MSSISRRVKQVRVRARVRAWEYRQRNLAHGAWYRFRRALGFADRAYAISAEEAERLLAEGTQVDNGGRELEPPTLLLWVTRERSAQLVSARPLALRLDAPLLASRWIALVPFDELGPPGPPPP